MTPGILSLAERAIRSAGTDDPREVAASLGILVVDLHGTIAGYAASYAGILPVIGLHVRLDGMWYRFGGWHELAHVLAGHIREKGMVDNGYFRQDVDNLAVSRHEREANLVSADVCVRDEDVYEETGYRSPAMETWRQMKAQQEQLLRSGEALRLAGPSSTLFRTKLKTLQRKIRETSEALEDLESDLAATNGKSFAEMAADLGITERILRYKLEAMRLKGLSIAAPDLDPSRKLFEGAL